MALLRTRWHTLAVVAGVLTLTPLPVLGNTYYLGLLTRVLVFALFAVALNVAFGHTDQLFLFTGGVAGIGAYATALLSDWLGVTAWFTLPIAILGCGCLGLAVSWLATRRDFTEINIAILTIALQYALIEAFIGARGLTGGSTGFGYDYLLLAADPFGAGLSSDLVVYYLSLSGLCLAIAVYLAVTGSKLGLAFDVIRDDTVAARAAGIDPIRTNSIAGFVTTALIGLGGVLYAESANHITPQLFTFLSVDVVVLVVLVAGGLRTAFGPLVGTAVLISSEQVFASAPHWRTALFGALLMVLFLYFTDGIVVVVRDQLEKSAAFVRDV